MAEKDIEWKNDLFIISDDQDWEDELLQELKARRPSIRCQTRKDAKLGSFKGASLVESVKLCKKVVAGFKSKPLDGNMEFAAEVAVHKMLADRTIQKGRLIPVKLDEDAELPDVIDVLTVGGPNDEDLYDKILKSLDVPEITQSERNDSQRDVIAQLNLQDFYPGKLTCEQALLVSRNIMAPNTKLTNENIPWVMLHHLLMCNYNGRCLVIPKKSTVNNMSDFLESLSNLEIEPKSEQISPADTLVALFLCCDNFLRQLLVEKLSMCQLAIPLLLPISGTDGASCEMFLWGLSTVRKKWKNSLGKTFEKSMVVHPLPIVSVLRLGKSRVSKSKVLNSLVLTDIKHDMFFHYGCNGGTVNRKITNGLMEIGWFLPRGENDVFPHPLTILNLRGNASHLKKQTSFLSEISEVTIGFTSCDTFEEEDAVLLESFYRQNGHFILVSDGVPEQKLLHSIKRLQKQYPPRKEKKITFVNSSNNNDLEISRQIWTNMSQLIDGDEHLVPDRSIEKCANIARTLGFDVDEQLPSCLQAKEHASNMLKCLEKTDKKQGLPLQAIAREIGDTKKEKVRHKHRGNKQIEMYNDEMQFKICLLRVQQKSIYEISTDHQLFKIYEKSFMYPSQMRKYFYSYVKILTDRYSFVTLQPIREKYFKKWNELCEAQKSHSERKKNENLRKDSVLQTLEIEKLERKTDEGQQTEERERKKELDNLECELVDLSLGIEHFNREIGQVYEMVTELKLQYTPVSQLPDIVAEMLLDGHPLELMDGDASHVPLSWIEAVFDSLKEKIGDKHMFILSVIGIQSSGKSTMLNAMFGLQFAVSAGRCTKGIFAKLVKVDPTVQDETNYDYILVVDTEGLRSTELTRIENDNHNHDNELATLVIGIGDVTIINIMGENPSDMQDTLQIAVHAFMQMDIVNIRPSCIFVHHNVTDLAASEMNATQKRKLVARLDEVTKSAAKVLKCVEQYNCFSDIIHFQENKDVLYVSSLWQGDPPTAPPNPGYSESIVKLKERIIESMKTSQSKQITHFKLRLSSVWNAVLSEDFVFSFRNAIEILAHNALETEYVNLSRTVRRGALTYSKLLQEECEKLTADEIDNAGNVILIGKLTKLDDDINELKKEMDMYFKKMKDARKWKAKIELKIEEDYADLKTELTNSYNSVKLRVKSRVRNDKITKKYQACILSNARKLAHKYRDTKLTEEKLEEIFDKEWNKWLSEIPHNLDPLLIEGVNLEKVVIESCESKLHKKIYNMFSKGFYTRYLVTTEIDTSSSFFEKVTNIVNKVRNSQHTTADKAMSITRNIRRNFAKEISKHGHEGGTYSYQFGLELFKKIREKLEERSEECNFKDKKVLELAVHILFSLLPELEKLQDKYRNETDPHVHMENQKTTFWHNFKNECTHQTMVIKIACSVTDELESAIKKTLANECIRGVTEHIPSSFQPFANKMSFHAQVLIDIGEIQKFEDFRPYLTNPFDCMKVSINKYIKNVCSSNMGNGCSVLENIYRKKLRDFFGKINRAIDIACQQKGKWNIHKWWAKFSSNICNDLVVSEQLMFLTEYNDFEVQDLKELLQEEIKKSEEKLTKSFKTIIKIDEIVEQSQLFFEKDLLGCEKLCPFCKAPCDLQMPNVGHRTECHRSQAVGGVHNDVTKKLLIELCTSSVGSDDNFKCEDTGWNWQPYKRYQEVNDDYKSWKIQPVVREQQLYWKWFMKTYNHELAKYYAVEPADIPNGWNDIRWESAKEDMMKIYNL